MLIRFGSSAAIRSSMACAARPRRACQRGGGRGIGCRRHGGSRRARGSRAVADRRARRAWPPRRPARGRATAPASSARGPRCRAGGWRRSWPDRGAPARCAGPRDPLRAGRRRRVRRAGRAGRARAGPRRAPALNAGKAVVRRHQPQQRGAARPTVSASHVSSPSRPGTSHSACGCAHSTVARASGALAGTPPATRSSRLRTIACRRARWRDGRVLVSLDRGAAPAVTGQPPRRGTTYAKGRQPPDRSPRHAVRSSNTVTPWVFTDRRTAPPIAEDRFGRNPTRSSRDRHRMPAFRPDRHGSP